MSIERQQQLIEKQIADIIAGIAQAKRDKAENFTIKQMEKTRRGLESKLEKLNSQARKDDVINFEQLGIDKIFVDEAHNYKNCARRCYIRQFNKRIENNRLKSLGNKNEQLELKFQIKGETPLPYRTYAYEDMLKSEAVCEIILHYADTTVICKCIKRGKDVT